MVCRALQHRFLHERRHLHEAFQYQRKCCLEVGREIIYAELVAQLNLAESLRLKIGVKLFGRSAIGVDVLLLGRRGECHILDRLKYGFIVPAAQAAEDAELLDAFQLELRIIDATSSARARPT